MDVSFDRVADIYDETRGFAQGVIERVVDALEKELSRESSVLEVGVGTGRIAAPLTERGMDVTGIDISKAMLAKAMSKGLSCLLVADARRLPFANRSFDHVLTVHVTHLISDWRIALAEIGRVARHRYASLTTDRMECDTEKLRKAYEDLCSDAGFEARHPGIDEIEISDVVRPFKTVPISDVTDTVIAKTAIGRLRSRTFSIQWSVPDEVHERAMAELDSMYEGVDTLERKERVNLVIWDAADIADGVWTDADGASGH